MYLNLVALVVEKWNSFTTADIYSRQIVGGVKNLLLKIFYSIQRDYGPALTRAAVGFISLSTQGVTDTEICDLLTLRPELLNEVNEYNTADRIPIHVWLRLREALSQFIVEREYGCLHWYHRQLKEAVHALLTDEERLSLHITMACYFGNLIRVDSRGISSQPLIYSSEGKNDNSIQNNENNNRNHNNNNSRNVWFSTFDSLLNRRRCIEAGIQLLRANMLREAIEELCNLDGICARIKCGELFSLISQLVKLSRAINHDNIPHYFDYKKKIDHYLRWLFRNAYTLSTAGTSVVTSIFATCTAEPLKSIVRNDIVRLMSKETTSFQPSVLGTVGSTSCCFSIGSSLNFDSLINKLEGHNGYVRSVAFSPNGEFVVSASGDMTLRIWDAVTGAYVMSFEGHTCDVYAVRFSNDGKRLISGSSDKTIKIWNVSTGF